MASGLLGVGLVLGANPARADAALIVKFPSDIVFAETGAGKPQIARLYGNPAKPGLYVLRMKFPAGFKVVPHTHPEETRTLTVLSGTLYFGFGEKWDESKMRPYPPGTFFTELPTTPHFVWAKDGEVVVQVSGIGPSGFNPAQLPAE